MRASVWAFEQRPLVTAEKSRCEQGVCACTPSPVFLEAVLAPPTSGGRVGWKRSLPLAWLQHSWLSESALERQREEEGCG